MAEEDEKKEQEGGGKLANQLKESLTPENLNATALLLTGQNLNPGGIPLAVFQEANAKRQAEAAEKLLTEAQEILDKVFEGLQEIRKVDNSYKQNRAAAVKAATKQIQVYANKLGAGKDLKALEALTAKIFEETGVEMDPDKPAPRGPEHPKEVPAPEGGGDDQG